MQVVPYSKNNKGYVHWVGGARFAKKIIYCETTDLALCKTTSSLRLNDYIEGSISSNLTTQHG